MERTSGKYYVLSALKRQYAERIPTTVLVGPYCCKMTGYSVKQILTDPQKSAEAHLSFYNRFEPDSLIVYNDIYLEAEAIGCELAFFDDRPSHPKSVVLNEKSRLAKLKVPNPARDGRIPYFIELCQRVSSEIKKTASMGLGHSGPWNIAAHLRGTESLMMDTYDDPAFVQDLMKFSTEVVRTVGDALIEAGFSPSLGEATASCSLISPEIYRNFIKPYHQELCRYFNSRKAPMALHVCGYIDPIMADIVETGISFLSLDAPSSLEKLLDLSVARLIVMGNVSTVLFSSGTREEMEHAIRNCIEKAAEGSGYILSSGCEIPLNSTQDRIAHYFNYAHQYSQQFMSSLKERRPELFVH
jgi:uroporphyrinogen decarboxylase